MLWRMPSLLLFQKNGNLHSKKTEKSQTSNKTVDTIKINKTDTVKSLDESRSTQITDT